MGSKKWGNTGMDDKCACFIAGAHRPIPSFVSEVNIINQKAVQIEDAVGWGTIGPPHRVWRNMSLFPRLLLVPREPFIFGDYLAALRVATSKMTAAARTSALTMYW